MKERWDAVLAAGVQVYVLIRWQDTKWFGCYSRCCIITFDWLLLLFVLGLVKCEITTEKMPLLPLVISHGDGLKEITLILSGIKQGRSLCAQV